MMQVIPVNMRANYVPNIKQGTFHAAPECYKLFGGAMGGGKTAAIINEGLELTFEYPGNFGLLMRKTWPSFRDTVLPQMEKFIPMETVKSWNLTSKEIKFFNRSRLRYGGVGIGPDDWKKFMSGEYGWIGLDQAEDFTKEEFDNLATRLRLMLPGIKYFFLLTCNPNVGWIKELFIENNLPDHIFIPSLPTDNAANLPADYVKRMRERLSPRVAQALLDGDWEAVGEPDNVYNYLQVQEAVERDAAEGEPYELGVDVARSGDDKTAIALRAGLKVSMLWSAQGADIMRTAGQVVIEIRKLKAGLGKKLTDVAVKVDCDGLGAGVYDRLKELKSDIERKSKLRLKLVEIHGAAKPSNPVEFKNYRSEAHWALRELLDVIQLPKDREIAAQLMAIKYKVNSAGQIEIIPKEEIKKKLGRSPDDAEAIIYALAQPVKKPQPRIRRIE